MLAVALERTGADVRPEIRTLLRAARIREKARWQTLHRICAPALATLAPLPVLVLKGVALAELVYDEPHLRHCHDIDLLVPASRLNEAAVRVSEADFRRAGGHGAHVRFEHASGLPLYLHTEPLLPRFYRTAGEALARARVASTICGVPVDVLSAEAGLVHACGHASYYRAGEALRWVCDAWHLIARTPGFDWDRVFELAVAARLTLPLAAQLEYLAVELGAAVPREVIDRLASVKDAGAERAALLGACSGGWRDVQRAVAALARAFVR